MRDILAMAFVIVVVASFGCMGSEWRRIPGGTDCVIALFPKDATNEQIETFLRTHTDGPLDPRGGHPLRQGIAGEARRGIRGQIGYEICFSPDATTEQQNAILTEMRASPAIERLLEGDEVAKALAEMAQ